MAIVINGSGTLSGLAVGGLPDGTVDSGTLATDSVVTGKIADGAIVNADINSSAAIAGSKLSGVGKVLQIVATTTTAQNSSTNTDLTAYSDIGLSVDITPLSSSSRFLITCTIGRGAITAGGGHNTWGGILFRDSTKIGNGADISSRDGAFFVGVKNWNGDNNHGGGAVGNSYWNTTTGTAGTQLTFKVGGVTEGSTMYINRSANFSDGSQPYNATTSSTITVMEVEA